MAVPHDHHLHDHHLHLVAEDTEVLIYGEHKDSKINNYVHIQVVEAVEAEVKAEEKLEIKVAMKLGAMETMQEEMILDKNMVTIVSICWLLRHLSTVCLHRHLPAVLECPCLS